MTCAGGYPALGPTAISHLGNASWPFGITYGYAVACTPDNPCQPSLSVAKAF